MTTSKLIRKLFKRGDKKDAEASKTSAAISPSVAALFQVPLQQKASRLLSLPGEIRNRIYDFAIYPSLSAIPLHHAPGTVLSLPIFAICRQMRSEAISKLCSSKSFSFSGLRIANAFFEVIGDGLKDLRFVTIYSETDWRSGSEEMAVEKVTLLDHLELATSLRSLQLVVGDFPLASQDEFQLETALSVGVQFLYAVRSVVDHERTEVEEERVIRERFLALCDQIGSLEAVCFLKEKLKKEHKERADRVFRVGRVASLEGNVKSVMLPLRLPEFLGSMEKHPKRTCYDSRNDYES